MDPIKTADKSANYSDEELNVLRKLVQFPEAVAQVSADYFPNNLCNYLFELSQNFNAFYQEVPVLQETDEQKRSFRLNLITATAQVIKNGLYLLGIEAPEEMWTAGARMETDCSDKNLIYFLWLNILIQKFYRNKGRVLA